MKKFYNTMKKRKMVFLILMVATALMVGACGKKMVSAKVQESIRRAGLKFNMRMHSWKMQRKVWLMF